MKKIIKKLILITFVFLFVISKKSYSFYISKIQESGLKFIHGRTNNYYFDKDLILKNESVKMTQDDNFYYFNVEADITLADHIKGIMTAKEISIYSNMNIRTYMGVTNQFVSNCMQPLLFGENNFTDERITEVCNFISYSGHQLNEHILYFGSKKIAQTHIEGTGNEGFGGNVTYWRSNYGNYFYFPHALAVYDGSYLGRTYNNGDYIPNVNEMLISHDGIEILSQSSFLKNWVLENNIVKEATIGCKTKLKIEKTKMDRYKYLAYGGLLYCSDYNHKSVDNTYEENLNAAFSMTGTFNIATYSNCLHSYEYTYEKNSDMHIKKCRKCEWTRKEPHNYIYEYDGIKNNMCECGKCIKIKYHYEINDDYNKIIEKEVEPYSVIPTYEYKEKEGYEFLYYEKYERKLDNDNNLNYVYSTATKSTLVKDVLIATMSTPDNIINDKSIIYKCVYEPIHLKINYHTEKGIMPNNKKYLSTNYTYWNLKIEKPKGDFGNEIYFDFYKYLDKKITNEKDIRKLIYKQNQEFNLEAIFNHTEYGKIERTDDKNSNTNDNKINSHNENIEKNEEINNNNETKEEYINLINEKEGEYKKPINNINKKENINKNNNTEKNKKILKMGFSEYEKLLNKIGIQKATFSNIEENGYYINEKNHINILDFINNIYVLTTFVFSIFIIIIILIIKREKNSFNK